MNLGELIAKAIETKAGNKEFVIWFDDDSWHCAIGNLSQSVPIGESALYPDSVEFESVGDTAVDVVQMIIDKMSNVGSTEK